jgi:hypothetical protein
MQPEWASAPPGGPESSQTASPLPPSPSPSLRHRRSVTLDGAPLSCAAPAAGAAARPLGMESDVAASAEEAGGPAATSPHMDSTVARPAALEAYGTSRDSQDQSAGDGCN